MRGFEPTKRSYEQWKALVEHAEQQQLKLFLACQKHPEWNNFCEIMHKLNMLDNKPENMDEDGYYLAMWTFYMACRDLEIAYP